MPNMRFVKDGWGHLTGDVAEKSIEDARVLIREGFAVDNDAAPPVERAVEVKAQVRKAAVKR